MTNRSDDVQRVEALLAKAGFPPFGPETGPTGMSGPVLEHATRAFQEANGLKPDGMIYTDGPTIKKLAELGRNGDTEIAHLTEGEVVIPQGVLTPELRDKIAQAFEKKGLEQGRYVVGGNDDSINPQTGAREYFEEKWVQEPTFFPDVEKKGIVRTKGPVKVYQKTSSLHPHAKEFVVDWYPLDSRGKPQAIATAEPSEIRRDWSGHPTVFTPHPHEFKPPYDNPNGWEMNIFVPPQAETSGNSGKQHFDIFTLKKFKNNNSTKN